MAQEKNLVLKIASRLLQYPDEQLQGSLDELSEMLKRLPKRPRRFFADFLLAFKDRSLISRQEEYSRTFDFNTATCLNLTYHQFGDHKMRGPALAELNALYRRAGYGTAPGELPDYLPLVLDFMSICSTEEYGWLMTKYRPQMETLAIRLQENKNPYAGLLTAVLDVLDS